MSTGEIVVADSGTAVGRARIAVLNATDKDEVCLPVVLLCFRHRVSLFPRELFARDIKFPRVKCKYN